MGCVASPRAARTAPSRSSSSSAATVLERAVFTAYTDAADHVAAMHSADGSFDDTDRKGTRRPLTAIHSPLMPCHCDVFCPRARAGLRADLPIADDLDDCPSFGRIVVRGFVNVAFIVVKS
jgi:hypothetical protein